jgi:hypothetical protein
LSKADQAYFFLNKVLIVMNCLKIPLQAGASPGIPKIQGEKNGWTEFKPWHAQPEDA